MTSLLTYVKGKSILLQNVRSQFNKDFCLFGSFRVANELLMSLFTWRYNSKLDSQGLPTNCDAHSSSTPPLLIVELKLTHGAPATQHYTTLTKYCEPPRTEKVQQCLRPRKARSDSKCRAAIKVYISQQALHEPADLCKGKVNFTCCKINSIKTFCLSVHFAQRMNFFNSHQERRLAKSLRS